LGALTLKSFSFELRGWDIEKLESIDPTDGFGTNTRVYVNKDHVIQIEPDYDVNNFNTWLTNKGRQFFDGLFNTQSSVKKTKDINNDTDSLQIILKLTKILYLFEFINQKKTKEYFFTIVFDNLSIETLSLLNLMSKKYVFLNIKKTESIKLNNDLEYNFQLNFASNNKVKLNNSTLCLLISTNTRYEGYYLNLNLRQRFLKGNFKCFILGSLINLTFPITFLGSNLKILKTILEGTNLICKEFKSAKNPTIILNSHIFKRQDIIRLLDIFQYLNNTFNNKLFNFNVLTPSLFESTNQNLNKFDILNKKDLNSFSSLYFLNLTTDNSLNLKQISEYKLLNYKMSLKTTENIEKILIDQSYKNNKNLLFFNNFSSTNPINFMKYFFLQNNTFYENEETFINTEGLIKRTNALIFQKKTRNSWQILRKILKQLSSVMFLDKKTNEIVFFNFKKLANFKNFIYFNYQATKSLTSVNFYLTTKNAAFYLNHMQTNFRILNKKITNTKLKYWLDDFFIGGKDEYSQNSLILSGCSKILRRESTNFF
jgi:NADH dehydrogenase/NADH:ubiquinone oxidoreductase subunit G